MTPKQPHRLALLVLLAVTAIAGITWVRQSSLPQRSTGPREFSSSRAFAALSNVLQGMQGHPTGSLANARARDLILQRLRDLAYTPTLQRTYVCGRHGACAFVENILAIRAGSDHANAVMLSAHYDSVPAAQGANDDGLGVAVMLEVARALTQRTAPLHDVYLLLTDGEERGLLGAEAFANEDPRIRSVRAVVNVESRGSSGPSLLFETTPANTYAVSHVAAEAGRPITSSLFSTIYERMPNDTDFTVWKPHATFGVNFATIGTLAHYHTTLDNLDNVDRGTLQHQGDNALAAVAAFMNAPDLATANEDRSVWFDLFGTMVVRYPEWLARGLAIACLLLATFGGIARVRSDAFTLRDYAAALRVPLVALLLDGVFAFGIAFAFRSLRLWPAPWVAHPAPFVATFALASALALFLAVRLVGRRFDHAVLWHATAAFVCIVHVLITAIAPGASYLFLPASLAFALGAAIPWRSPDRSAGAARVAAPILGSAIVWSSILCLLPDALGFSVPVAHGLAWAFALLPALPLIATLRDAARANAWPITVTAALVAAGVTACLVPPFSEEHPMRVNVVFHQDAVGSSARLMVDPTWSFRPFGVVPDSMRSALTQARAGVSFPWTPNPIVEGTAPRLLADAPEATVLRDSRSITGHDVTLRVHSPRGASTIGVVLPPDSTMQITMANHLAATPRVLPSGYSVLLLHATPPEGVELSLTGGIQPVEAHVFDITYDVPPSAANVVRARPRDAVPTQDGDATVLTRRIVL